MRGVVPEDRGRRSPPPPSPRPVAGRPDGGGSLQRVELDQDCHVLVGRLPDALVLEGEAFEDLWALHPERPPVIRVGPWVGPVPRWKQAYDHDYSFSGQTTSALPLPACLAPILSWARQNLDHRLSGTLVNWYDAAQGHYIGPHRDQTAGLVDASPIVTVSPGAARTLRLSRKGGDPFEIAGSGGGRNDLRVGLRW